MKKGLITVIIPIYNSETFLKLCLDSLRSQTFQNYEVFLINDGSIDNSGRICEEYNSLDSRFKVIHQKNAGVSAARNCALKKANGDYIFFLDSDDVLPVNALESLIKEQADLTVGSIAEINEFGELNGKKQILFNQKLSRLQMIEALFDETRFGYQGYLWNKLYKLSIIKEHNIQFDTKIHYNEDRLFILQYLMYCSQVTILSSIVYFYRQQKNSAMAKMRRNFESTALTELDAFEKMKNIVKDEYPNLYHVISHIAFEKSLYWFNQIPSSYSNEKMKARKYIYKNAKICLKKPGASLLYRIKIIFHSIFKR